MLYMSVTAETSQLSRGWLKAVAPSNMLRILVTDETSQEEMSPLKAVAPLNIPLMSVTDEISQEEMSPLKEAAPTNISDMSVTRERSGVSIALWVMLEAPEKAAAMLVHELLPHCSIEIRLVLLSSLSKWNCSRPPVTVTG